MMDDTDRETQPAGRVMRVLAFGDTATEIELAGLDEARAFFGADLQLRVIPDYKVFPALPGEADSGQAGGKKYRSSVLVLVVEPG